MNPSFIEVSPSIWWQSGALRRRHELRTDGIDHGLVYDAVDQIAPNLTERPARDTQGCLDLIRATAAPKRDADTLVEHPAHGQMDYAPVKTALGELIELAHRLEILSQARRLEFGVYAPQIVAVEGGVGPNASAQQAPAQRPVAQRRDIVRPAIRQDILLDLPFEEVVGWL